MIDVQEQFRAVILEGFPERIIFVNGHRHEGTIVVAVPITQCAATYVQEQFRDGREVVVETMENCFDLFGDPEVRGLVINPVNPHKDVLRLNTLVGAQVLTPL